MKAKYLLPYEHYILQTRLTLEEVRQRLDNVVDRGKGRWIKIYRRSSHKLYNGILCDEFFKISRVINYRNSFLPVVKGQFYEVHGQTYLNMKLTLSIGVSVFMTLWLGLIGTFCVLILANIYTEFPTIFQKGLPFPFDLIIMFIFGYCLTLFAFKYESKKTKAFLIDLVDGKELTDLS